MRCLYCGKELALLKRLRGGGEFCSDAHKQSYQEEYNRLGLSRLLQARSRADESKGVQKPPAQPAVPVAVEERPVEELAPEIEEAVEQIEEVTVEAVAPAVIAVSKEPAPPPMAGFAMETPSISAAPEPVSYLEPWTADEAVTAPSQLPAPAWHLEGPPVEHPVFTLRSANLVPLELQPGICESSYSVMDSSVTPREEGLPRVHLSMPLTVSSSHEFERGGSVAIEISPRPSESSSYASLNGALDFSYPADRHVFELLDLAPAGIGYPAEECDVTVPGSWTNGIISPSPLEIDGPIDIIVPAIPRDDSAAGAPDQAAAPPIPEATPRAALKALSRLHKDMRDREEAKPATPPAEPALPAAAESSSNTPAATEPSSAEPSSAEPSSAEPTPREAEFLAIPVKSFAPPKASPVIDAAALLTNSHPLLPRLKALPLRAKVALAPRGFGQPVAKAPEASAPPPGAAPPKPAADTSPNPAAPAPEKKVSPPAPAAKAKPTVPSAPPVQSVPAQPQSKPEQLAKNVPVKSAPAGPKPQPPQPQNPEPAEVTKATPPPKSEPAQKVPARKEEPAKVKAAAAASSPASGGATIPNFGAVVNTSMFGSLTAKLGIAALIILVALAGYFGLIPKSGRSSASAAKSADSPGMSIMVGEGGWVENWAGDPIGQHGGREITIYRPSLKLSDYRIEFQGQIDNKSIGWIFRAADTDNYYAMKLQLVSPELPLTVVLYKYIVIKGRQVQVGRVPIDVPVRNDTVFSVRMDVRGPKFTTYVQGQSVDVWTDDQIRSGGVGFLNERSERGKIKSVSLSYLSGGTK
jgi:hypothetical protein